MQQSNNAVRSLTIAIAAAALAACGGGGSGSSAAGDPAAGDPAAGDPMVSTTTVGTITGFGSIFVNGIEFETDDASFRVDDQDRYDDSALALGMKVRVTGSVDGDGRRGRADSVYYDDDIKGPIDAGSVALVDAATKTFRVFGLAIRSSVSGTVFDDGASFDALAEGQRVEVSGFFDGSELIATRIEGQGGADGEHEIKGVVQGYDGDTITLALVNGVEAGPFAIGAGAELEIPAQPLGSFVEVKLVAQGGSLVAVRVQAEDDDLLDHSDGGARISLRGILKGDGGSGFLLGGTRLALGAGTDYEPGSLRGSLAAGMEVKVEGRIEAGVLRVDEIAAGRGEEELGGRLVSLTLADAKTGTLVIDLGDGDTVEISTGSGTTFEDDSELDLDDDHSFDLDELHPGSDYLDIEAYVGAGGRLIATRIERNDAQ